MNSDTSGKRTEEKPEPMKAPSTQKVPGRQPGVPGGESTIADPNESSGPEYPADPGMEGNPKGPRGPSAGSEAPIFGLLGSGKE